MEFKWPVRVYIEDTDAGGIVYYVNYLKYMERARTEFLRYLGVDHAEMLRQGAMFVIHSANVNYKQPACLDDELEITVRIEKVRRSYVCFEQQIFCGEQLLTQASIKGVCVKKETMKPCSIPQEIVRALKVYIGDC